MVIFIFFKCKKWQSALQKRVLNNYESRLFPFKKVSFHILHKTGRNPCNELCVTSARAAPPLHKYPFCTHYILEQLLICKNHRSNLNSYELYYWRSMLYVYNCQNDFFIWISSILAQEIERQHYFICFSMLLHTYIWILYLLGIIHNGNICPY